MAKTKRPIRIKGTYYLSLVGADTEEVRSLILRRRLQLLVHSYIYYEGDKNLIPDRTWDMWAKELVVLQRKYPTISQRVDYYEHFKEFTGDTGFDLPYRLPEISSKAIQLMKQGENQHGLIGHKANRTKHHRHAVRLLHKRTKV